MMTKEAIAALDHGDIVRHGNGEAFVVLQNDGKTVTAVRTIIVSNPIEWTLLKRHDWTTET
jgi:hypothetical protein